MSHETSKPNISSSMYAIIRHDLSKHETLASLLKQSWNVAEIQPEPHVYVTQTTDFTRFTAYPLSSVQAGISDIVNGDPVAPQNLHLHDTLMQMSVREIRRLRSGEITTIAINPDNLSGYLLFEKKDFEHSHVPVLPSKNLNILLQNIGSHPSGFSSVGIISGNYFGCVHTDYVPDEPMDDDAVKNVCKELDAEEALVSELLTKLIQNVPGTIWIIKFEDNFHIFS